MEPRRPAPSSDKSITFSSGPALRRAGKGWGSWPRLCLSQLFVILLAGAVGRMMSELPRQTFLFLGERGPTLGRLCPRTSPRRPPARGPIGEWWLQEGEQRFTRWSSASQPEGAPVSLGLCRALAQNAARSLLFLSTPMLGERAAPAEERCWPQPSGGWRAKPS